MSQAFESPALAARAGVAGDRAFRATNALLFVASAAGTIYWCGSMSGGMPMPGGWTMSMAWMRMPGQTWPGAAALFMGMWVLMMVAMMLPSLVPMLSTFRRSVRGPDEARLGSLTTRVGAGYFLAWTIVGAVAYPPGIALAAAEMRWPALARAVPLLTGAVILLAGCVQFTEWKARQLGHCRDAPGCALPVSLDARAAWRHGLRLGAHCASCCAGFMAILLVAGVMDLGVMAVVSAAITVERLAARPENAARASGVVAVTAGAFVIARALAVV
jgi:predicted metal-binding membrane protein